MYRAVLRRLMAEGKTHVFSHRLGDLAGATSAQVRRDLMVVGGYGTAAHGYEIEKLLEGISDFMDAPRPTRVGLVGVGNLGRAILAFFARGGPNMEIVAAFDKDGRKTGRSFEEVPCHHVDEMEEVVREKGIEVAIVAVPAEAAQPAADSLVRAGIRGMLSLAPVCLEAPEEVYVETADLGVFVDKTIYFACHPDEDEA
jgi:redox-sensing transcriptional repressor